MRMTTQRRRTAETNIALMLNIDGSGVVDVVTGVPFFDHMLEAFGRHGGFNMTIHAEGDIEVDDHHTVEDVGIVIGQALAAILEDKEGITRFGHSYMAMDEALVLAAIDISGRGQCYYELDIPVELIGTFDTTLAHEFFIALAREAGLTLHIRSFEGVNAHHLIEAAFKAVARALRVALTVDPRVVGVPSTKGSL
ncbi:MAG: imidazoleglycerol-phosphate dehydratase HisB [Actinomycetia bacterium]|nr:imidazoleglycerol-phosphate dehydratase HisB [Actinomycetes bacterium]